MFNAKFLVLLSAFMLLSTSSTFASNKQKQEIKNFSYVKFMQNNIYGELQSRYSSHYEDGTNGRIIFNKLINYNYKGGSFAVGRTLSTKLAIEAEGNIQLGLVQENAVFKDAILNYTSAFVNLYCDLAQDHNIIPYVATGIGEAIFSGSLDDGSEYMYNMASQVKFGLSYINESLLKKSTLLHVGYRMIYLIPVSKAVIKHVDSIDQSVNVVGRNLGVLHNFEIGFSVALM